MTARGATPGAYLIAAIGGALYLAARTTGAGWLMVILCALAGVLAVAVIWPRLALSRVRVRARGPRDASVGEAIALTLEVERAGLGVRLRPLDPPGGWAAVVGDGGTVATARPQRRGVVDTALIEVSSAAPFGLVWWRIRVRAALERPLEVAPRRVDIAVPTPRGGARDGDSPQPVGPGGDRVRGLRDYVHGDPMRLVHWPATARRGQVVVKELEQPERRILTVVVDLRGPAEPAERAAERAMGVVSAALDDGLDVTLCTAERGGPRASQVSTPLQAGRLLARAVAGEPGSPSGGAPVVRISATGNGT